MTPKHTGSTATRAGAESRTAARAGSPLGRTLGGGVLPRGRSPFPFPTNPLRVYDSIADLVPKPDDPTPLVRLSDRFNPHPGMLLYLKLEGGNPFGSIKDRAALSMLRGARIEQGQTLIEPSSGNTGVALAALANAEGIPVEIAVPEGTPEEKKALLRLLGARLWESPDDLCPMFPSEGARGLVKGIVESPRHEGRYVSPNQYESKLNVDAHYTTTGPEIWQQTEGRVDTFFAGFGTCGTITGVGRFLKERNPKIRIVGVEPASRDHRLPGMKRISDLSEDLVPGILDRSLLSTVVEVEDERAYQTGIHLARTDGILVGPTTGAILAAALDQAAEATARGGDGRRPATGVVISPDSALKYVSLYARYLETGEALD